MNNNEDIIRLNKSRKKENFDYVIKTASSTLDLIKSNDDPLLSSLGLFIDCNLGFSVDVRRPKYQVLNDISVLFEERTEKITKYNLDKLEMKMYGLDRNIEQNKIIIKDFIFEHYNIHIPEDLLCPSIDNSKIIDYMIDFI